MENISFPQYRKYANGRTFFRIISSQKFEELTIIGNYYKLTNFQSSILPDRIFIEDMLQNNNNYWLESNEDEFNERLNWCQENLKKLTIDS